MEVNDPPNRIRYREMVCISVAGQIEFLPSCPTVGCRNSSSELATIQELTE